MYDDQGARDRVSTVRRASTPPVSQRRRALLQASVATAGVSLAPWARAQSEPIKIGHLTPMTGFLGALGEYAVMGIRLAAEEINAAGGVNGRKLDVMSEDSVNPQVASSKAQRMIERDGVAVLMGEISSASALTISQVAARNKKLFMSIGARSDALRGKECNRYTFHVDIPVTVMVNAVGHALVRDKMAYLLKIRQARPDVIATNLAGNQVTNFVKQYAEFGLPYPVVGFNLNTADAWAAGEGNLGGIWPTVWHHELQTQGSKTFVANFQKKYGKIPENHAWIEYVSLMMLAQALKETKSTDTDKLIAYFESEAKFDILKKRPAYFRSWDHQLMQEAYPFTVKAKGESKGKQDFLKFGEAVPAPDQPLESLAPTRAESDCKM